MNKVIFRIAKTEAEIQQCFSIRHSVFVEEQKLFKETDQDEVDNIAIHIAALDADNGNVVSTVRCHEANDGIWYGSRLAVPRDYRNHPSQIGVRLCKLAEKTVANRGAKRFLAYIQTQNIRFFEGLRWRKIDNPVMHFGLLHQLMEASLFVVNKKTENSVTKKVQPAYAQD